MPARTLRGPWPAPTTLYVQNPSWHVPQQHSFPRHFCPPSQSLSSKQFLAHLPVLISQSYPGAQAYAPEQDAPASCEPAAQQKPPPPVETQHFGELPEHPVNPGQGFCGCTGSHFPPPVHDGPAPPLLPPAPPVPPVAPPVPPPPLGAPPPPLGAPPPLGVPPVAPVPPPAVVPAVPPAAEVPPVDPPAPVVPPPLGAPPVPLLPPDPLFVTFRSDALQPRRITALEARASAPLLVTWQPSSRCRRSSSTRCSRRARCRMD